MNLWTDPLDAELVNDAVSAKDYETGAFLRCHFKGHKTFCPSDQFKISISTPFL